MYTVAHAQVVQAHRRACVSVRVSMIAAHTGYTQREKERERVQTNVNRHVAGFSKNYYHMCLVARGSVRSFDSCDAQRQNSDKNLHRHIASWGRRGGGGSTSKVFTIYLGVYDASVQLAACVFWLRMYVPQVRRG